MELVLFSFQLLHYRFGSSWFGCDLLTTHFVNAVLRHFPILCIVLNGWFRLNIKVWTQNVFYIVICLIQKWNQTIPSYTSLEDRLIAISHYYSDDRTIRFRSVQHIFNSHFCRCAHFGTKPFTTKTKWEKNNRKLKQTSLCILNVLEILIRNKHRRLEHDWLQKNKRPNVNVVNEEWTRTD